MEAINPNDIEELDTGAISYITLKNGNKLMIDDSVPQKLKKEKNQINEKSSKNGIFFQPLTISVKEPINNNNNVSNFNNNNTTNIFSNNIPNMSSSEQNLSLKEKPKSKFYIENNTVSTNNAMSSNNEENKEDKDDVKSKVTRKSQTLVDKIEQMIKGKNNHTIKAVMSIFIPSDIQHQLSNTQKQFDKLVVKFRQKQNKFKRSKEGVNSYRLYNLYKNNNNKIYNDVLSPKKSRIKYYQEHEKEKFVNKVLSFSNEKYSNKTINSNRHDLFMSKSRLIKSYNNNLNRNKSSNVNDNKFFSFKESTNSLYTTKYKSVNDKRVFNTKLVGKDFGYSSALIYPSNRFKSKLDPYYFN